MTEIKPHYITFEQAKLLKEKGFDETCNAYFDLDKKITLFNDKDFNRSKNSDMYPYIFGEITLPEQWQVIEWLRVNHNIEVFVTPLFSETRFNISYQNRKYDANIIINGKYLFKKQFKSPQEAYSAAFSYILKEVI